MVQDDGGIGPVTCERVAVPHEEIACAENEIFERERGVTALAVHMPPPNSSPHPVLHKGMNNSLITGVSSNPALISIDAHNRMYQLLR